MPRRDSALLEKTLRLKFKNPDLLREALTHKSWAMERGTRVFNERLEFLGDSVLAAVVAHYLFKRYPDDDEGTLSKLKSRLVSRSALVVWAKDIGLGDYLWMSEGEEGSGGRERESLLANVFEALLGAVFLDRGFSAAQRVVLRQAVKTKDLSETDHKSRLQEIVQKRYKVPPSYTLEKEKGPDHSKVFVMHVTLRGKRLGEGEGRSKKEAEQAAALAALQKISTHRLSSVIDPLRRIEDDVLEARRDKKHG